MKKIFYYDTYVGRIGIAEEDGAITDITFSERDWQLEETGLIKMAMNQLDEYFDGKRTEFDFPVRLEGTEFQKRIWETIRTIPYGKTASYKDIAIMAGCQRGFRAVGMANNRNHIAIVYPCHRIIGADGSLTGYGAGLNIKEKLLSLEKKYSNKMAVGVDIGGTAIKIGLFTEEGTLTAKKQIPTRNDDSFAYVLNDAAKGILELLKENSINRDSVKGIGIGVPGPVAGGVVKHCVNLMWKNSVDASGIIEKLTGIKACVLNDANAAALGEQWMGGGKGRSSMLLVTIGTGIGGGIVINNDVLAGNNGAGGEIGHITVEYDSPRSCNCGRNGCLETYASATGIVRTARELLEKNNFQSSLEKRELSAKAIFDEAKNKDEIALEAVDIFGKYLGRALANIAAIVDPEIIVLSGGVVKAGKIVSDAVEKYFKESAFKTVRHTPIVLAELENDAGIYGAAKEALKLN